MLLLEATHEPLTILPTHRVARGVEPGGSTGRLLQNASELFELRTAGRAELLAAFGGGGPGPGGRARFGGWAPDGGRFLRARARAFPPVVPAGGPVLLP